MSVPKDKQCPNCGTETWIDLDDYSWYERCPQCGYTLRFEGLRYENGVEVLVVSTHNGLVAQTVTSRAKRLKNSINSRVKEARVLILAQLSKGPLTKRTLRIKLRQEDVFKPAFEYAIRQLLETGIVKTLKSTVKRSHKKFALWTFVAGNSPLK